MPLSVRRKTILVAILVSAALALVLTATAAASYGGLTPVTPRSPNAHRITRAYELTLAVAGAVFLVVEATLITFLVRFRRRGRPRTEDGAQIHGSTRLELTWTVIPVLLITLIIGFVFYNLPSIKNPPSAAAAGPHINIKVEAHQFYWRFIYPDGRESINTLFVPVDRVVTLDVTTADVIHSWWVPALGGKIDTMPGKTNHTWFQAERVGTYAVRCAEFCGIQHAAMKGFVRVTSSATATSWRLGKQAFEGVCASCHGFSGEGLIGPAIATNPILEDPKALRVLIHDGAGKMPAVGATWDEQLMNDTIGYLKSRFGGKQSGG